MRSMYRGTQRPANGARPERRLRVRGPGGLRLTVLLVTMGSLLSACGEPAPAVGERPAAAGEGVVIDVRLELADGTTLPVDAFEGSWLFVNYWAEWCAPCLEEIPELNELEHEVDGARVLGINFDGLEAAVIREQMETLGIAFPVAVGDPGAALGLRSPEVLPSTYVFDPDGVQQGVLRGPQTMDMLRAAMRSMDAAGN